MFPREAEENYDLIIGLVANVTYLWLVQSCMNIITNFLTLSSAKQLSVSSDKQNNRFQKDDIEFWYR